MRTLLGIMSGTSLDGVDCVLISVDRVGRPRWERHWTRRFPGRLRERLMACASGEASSWDCGQCHHDLGRFYADVARLGLERDRVDAVGLHGQTVFHRGDGRLKATFQLGEPAYLAQALQVPVVSNFRAGDMAVGGQGAPLATLFHVRVFGRPGEHVCVQNLGGIGNVTSIDARSTSGAGSGSRGPGRRSGGGALPRVMAFDTGPGNMVIDDVVRRITRGREGYDRDGRRAAAGVVEEALLRGWLRHRFFRKAPPKSTGREAFGRGYVDGIWGEMDRVGLVGNDRVATLTELTAAAVVWNYRWHLVGAPDRVVVCGGGARNPTLMARLEAGLKAWNPGTRVSTCDGLGWPVEAVEGGAFALLARERLLGRPGNLPETTGAARTVRCGQVTVP